MHARRRRGGDVLGLLVARAICLFAGGASAQPPPPPPAPPPPDPGLWEGTAGAGLALTRGNSDTLTFNLAFDATRDPEARNVIKAKGLFLRGEQDDELVANRLSFAVRDQFALNERAFVFGQVSIGLATKISERLQLSCDLLDTFKNRPPTAATKKNDVALVTAVTAKF
jgi:putative salt-induced outer membrane protein YdiY